MDDGNAPQRHLAGIGSKNTIWMRTELMAQGVLGAAPGDHVYVTAPHFTSRGLIAALSLLPPSGDSGQQDCHVRPSSHRGPQLPLVDLGCSIPCPSDQPGAL